MLKATGSYQSIANRSPAYRFREMLDEWRTTSPQRGSEIYLHAPEEAGAEVERAK